MCKPCQERWRIVLAQQSKFEIMKKDLKSESGKTVSEQEVIAEIVSTPKKLDVEKLIAERRKIAEQGKTINK